MRRIIASLVLLVIAGCASSSRQVTTATLRSPSGRYAGAFEDSDLEFAKRLVVRDQTTKQVLVNYQVERDAVLVFSPSEERVVVIDNFASNENRLCIFDLRTNHCQVVGREIGQLDPASRHTMLQYSHVYFRDLQWLGNDIITCIVDVYDPLFPNVARSSTLSLTVPVSWAWRKAGVMRSTTALVLPFASK
jgi:hypothetical protein